jgi:hypothetical protein
MTQLPSRRPGARRVAAAAFAALALAGCNDFLTVENPAAIEEPSLESPSYIQLLANSVVGEFQPMYPQVIMYSGVFGDELRNNHVFFENRLIDQRQIAPDNGTYAGFVYNTMQRTRYMADTAVGRMRILLGDSARVDLRVARSLALAGYTYTIMGERLCGAPVNGGATVPWQGLLDTAFTRFDAALEIASRVRDDAARPAGQRLVADSIFFLAKAGGSRAALMRNLPARARTYATGIPTAWEYRLNYSTNSPRENNPFQAWTLNQASTIFSYEARSFARTDPRLPGNLTLPTGANTQNSERTFIPSTPASFGGFANTLAGVPFAQNAFIRLASGLEAQYVLAETDGPVASTLAFVNTRRAAGLQPAVNLTGDALMAELREQRFRDFFLDGRRVGDMRRYLAYLNVDTFARGAYPLTTTGESYGAQTCMPLTNAEIFGNPNATP